MSDPFSAILHPGILAPDFKSMRSKPPQEAADALRGLLASLEGVEDQVFAARGMACLLIEERELFRQSIDPEVDRPYESLDRFLKVVCPKSWSYCRDALRTVKALKETPFTDLLEIKRCNLETLAKVSTNVRKEPKVIEAAKSLPEKEFTQKMNREFNQHIESKSTLKLTYAAGEMAEIEKALDWVKAESAKAGIVLEDRASQLLALCIDLNIDHAENEAA
jgi:DNA polymerase III delta subunit